MRFYHILILFLISLVFTIPLPQPQPDWIESILETIGRFTGHIGERMPATTGAIVEGSLKVAFDDPQGARGAVEAMAKGATEAALKDPKAAFALAEAAGRGSWLFLSKTAKDKVDALVKTIRAVSTSISKWTHVTVAKIPGLARFAPVNVDTDAAEGVTTQEDSLPRNPIEAGRRALKDAFDKIADTVSGLKTKIAELQLRVFQDGVKGALAAGQSENGRFAISELSEGVAEQLLADSQTPEALALAEATGKILTEEALKQPGAALSLARSAISGAQPLVAAYLMKSLQEYLAHVDELITTVPTESLQKIKIMGAEMKDRMQKTLGGLLKNAPADIDAARLVQPPAGTITDPELVAESEKMAVILRESLESFEEVANSLVKIKIHQ